MKSGSTTWAKSPITRPGRKSGRRGVFRVVQRLDGFVSADAPYQGGQFTTRPLRFEGRKLVLNIDTSAVGFAQVGLQNPDGSAIEGFEVENCVYINGDHFDKEVEWLDRGKDVSEIAGRPVQLVFRMRGSKLYSMQFVE